jgi:hypothetical protein
MYQTSEERDEFKKANTSLLLVNPNYHVLPITVPWFDVQHPSKLLTHFIVGALFMYDDKRGSYVNDRIPVVGAPFVTSSLTLNSNF